MCTAINFVNQQGENVFGRTMDFHFIIDPQLAVFPAGCEWENMRGQTFADCYGVAGINRHVKNLYVLFDGVNETGLAGGALYFKGYANFPAPSESCSKKEIPALDFLHYALGQCSNLKELKELLHHLLIVGIRDKVTNSVAPMHWIFTDLSGSSIVIEQTDTGMNVYDNPVGVLTNSPDFPWQMTNLRNYTQITTGQTEEADWDGFIVDPVGQAAGTNALPGGYTPPARFVRTAFQKLHMVKPEKMKDSINAGFHILENVTIPKGVVKTANGTFDYTQYTVMIDLQKKEYYFKTYDNPQMIKVDIKPFWTAGKQGVQDLGSIELPVSYGTLNTKEA